MKARAKKVLLLLLAAIFLFSAYQLLSYRKAIESAETEFDSLRTAIGSEEIRADHEEMPEEESKNGQPKAEEKEANDSILLKYADLYKENQDLFGWIRIEGTKVDYPVMHTPKEPEFYLHRGFDGAGSQSGVPFLAADCTRGCGNYIIYGHNMRSGSMFASLLSYGSEEFWQNHPLIQFDTLYETGTYRVLAAFQTKIYNRKENGAFRYYQYTDLRDPEIFHEYMEQVKSAAMYQTGVEAEYGDELLTLSTCSYHTKDGRFVVVARREG